MHQKLNDKQDITTHLKLTQKNIYNTKYRKEPKRSQKDGEISRTMVPKQLFMDIMD